MSRVGICLAYIGFRIIVHYISRISVISQQSMIYSNLTRMLNILSPTATEFVFPWKVLRRRLIQVSRRKTFDDVSSDK